MITEGLGKVPDHVTEESLSGHCALLNASISLAVTYALVQLNLLDLFRIVVSRVEKRSSVKLLAARRPKALKTKPE